MVASTREVGWASGKDARNEGGSPKEKRNSANQGPQTLPLFTINIHNFAFSLAAHGPEKRRTTARGLMHSATKARTHHE